MKRRFALLLSLGLIAIGCTDAPSDNLIDEARTRAVLDHHWDTFVNNDLEGVMEDYTSESILITPNGTFVGLEEIRANFVNAFKAFPTSIANLTLNESRVVKDVGYILWVAETPGFNLTYATDTFIIQNGKIVRQTFAGVRETKE
nr:nuclear transport factor 2 family protein [Cytophagales bacterium]